MKRSLVWAGAFLIVIGTVALAVRADVPARYGWRRHAAMGCIAGELNLSSAQKAQIKSIWNTERPTIARLVSQFARENKEMQTLTAQKHPDPNKVQSIADLEGSTLSELLTEKEKLKMQIEMQVLKPDQRAKVEDFENHINDHIDQLAQRLSH